MSADHQNEQLPDSALEEWEGFVKERYPNPDTPGKTKDEFRNYEADARPTVRQFYRLNHRLQTFDFVQAKRKQYLALNHREMGIWEAMEFLNHLVDDSDPDTSLSQIEHLLQTAEQIRRDGHPPWFVLTGAIHDLGKILCLFDEPQWAVVGDTFPVGCAYSEKIVFHDYFKENPDYQDPRFQTPCGIYAEGSGLKNVFMSWGHDEYLFQVVKDYLPEEALYMIRYHSFYPWHREGEYGHLMDSHDREMLPWVKAFNPYDLYTKSHQRPDIPAIRPYYEELFAKYFPPKLKW